jgi:hypothetical protein
VRRVGAGIGVGAGVGAGADVGVGVGIGTGTGAARSCLARGRAGVAHLLFDSFALVWHVRRLTHSHSHSCGWWPAGCISGTGCWLDCCGTRRQGSVSVFIVLIGDVLVVCRVRCLICSRSCGC